MLYEYSYVYMCIFIQHTQIYAYIYSAYTHSCPCYIMLYEYSYLKVKSILNRGAEVATLLSHTNFGRMHIGVVEDD